MRGERVLLNAALQQTNDEQLLLNLVRLRYRDTPAFLQVSSISSQIALEVGIDGGIELERSKINTDLFTFGGRTGYSTRPTLSYTPLQGNEFIQQLLTPLTVEKMLLLYRSGWNIRRLFSLCVQRINELRNAPRASGPTPGKAPEFEDFSKAVDMLRALERKGFIDIGYETLASDDANPRVVLHIDPRAQKLPETTKLRKLLNLAPGETHYPLIYSQIQQSSTAPVGFIEIDTRSLIGIMFLLSNAVEVSKGDIQKGKVKQTLTDTGEPFDWGNVLGEYLRISVDDVKPTNTLLTVNYRGHWFYIDDSDLESKSTFVLLAQIFALQADKAEGIVPVLTLPVGR